MGLVELLLIGILATYRLTFMLNEEGGPGDVFGKFRYAIGIRADEHSRLRATNIFAEAVMCYFCLSVWVALGVFSALALLQVVVWQWVVLLPFAFSGGAIFLKRWAG